MGSQKIRFVIYFETHVFAVITSLSLGFIETGIPRIAHHMTVQICVFHQMRRTITLRI
jgi:hypothetical protein